MITETTKPATVGAVCGLRSAVGYGDINSHEVSELRPRKQDAATKKWLLSRFRSAYSGALLVVSHIEEIGKDLAADRIDIEQAAWNLNAIEETPLLYLSSLLTPVGEAA